MIGMELRESCRELRFGGHDVDSLGQVKLQRVLAYFEDIAEENATKNGFGHSVLSSKDLSWVMIQVELKIHKYPVLGGRYILKSWPCNVKRVFAYRAYQIVNEDNPEEVLIEAMAMWVIMDIKNRAMVIPDKVGINMPLCPDGCELFDMTRKKIKKVDGNIKVDIVPKYSDYDINAHVNNTKYVEWLCNTLPIEKVRNIGFDSLSVVYKKEIREGQEVSLEILDEDEEFVAVGSDSDGQGYFECFGRYRKG